MTTNNSIDRPAATQTDQENFVSTTTYVQPGVQQYHPGHPKAWCQFSGTGTPAIITSYNCTSITDTGQGLWGVNYIVAFATNDYCAVTVGDNSVASASAVINSITTGTVNIRGVRFTDNTSQDLTSLYVVCCGDQ